MELESGLLLRQLSRSHGVGVGATFRSVESESRLLLGQLSRSHGVGVGVTFRSVESESWSWSRGYF